MPHAAFVISDRSSYPLREFITAVSHELERQGVPCRTHAWFPPPRPDQVYLLVSPGEWVANEGEAALPDAAVLKRTILLGAERPSALTAPSDVALHQRVGAVFDISQRAVVRLHQLGVPARLLRPGYSSVLDHFDADADRPIDVVFLGADSPRRRERLAELAGTLARLGCVLRRADGSLPPGESDSFSAQSRWPLLARTKVLINIHRDGPSAPMEWLRMMDAFHSGAVLLSEPGAQTLPFTAGEQFVTARGPAMGAVLSALLDDPKRLATTRSAAYERLRDWLPLAASVSVLRAAIVELVGTPYPRRVGLGVGGRSVAEEPREDVAVRSELEKTRRELDGLRRSVESLRATVASAAAPPPPSVLFNGAWKARRSAPVSLLVALGEVGSDVEATLDSMALGRTREREIIIVGRDGSPAMNIAHLWTRRHPRVPIALATAAMPGDLSRWRTGIAFSRSPLCLVVGVGDGIYPRALEVLSSALEDSDAYSVALQAQRASSDAPARLIPDDAAYARERTRTSPLLIRTNELRATLAAGTQIPGHQDVGLLAQLAGQGLRGSRVSQILAWRTAPERVAS